MIIFLFIVFIIYGYRFIQWPVPTQKYIKYICIPLFLSKSYKISKYIITLTGIPKAYGYEKIFEIPTGFLCMLWTFFNFQDRMERPCRMGGYNLCCLSIAYANLYLLVLWSETESSHCSFTGNITGHPVILWGSLSEWYRPRCNSVL